MKSSARLLIPLAILILGMARAGTAVPTIYADPELSAVDAGDTVEVRVMVNADAESISSFDLVFEFDTGVLEFLPPVIEGALFLNPPDPGWYTWFQSGEEVFPGQWEVFDVMLPGGSYVLAPGELCRLRFLAVADGYTEIAFVEAWLTDRQRRYISPLEALGGRVCVGNLSGVADRAGRDFGIALGLPSPNPTSDVVRMQLIVESWHGGQPLSAGIYDAAGRLVCLLRVESPGASRSLMWDGRDMQGNRAGAGTYFVRLCAPEAQGSRKIVLLR